MKDDIYKLDENLYSMKCSFISHHRILHNHHTIDVEEKEG